MARIQFQLDVDDRKIQEIVKKKHKLAVALEPTNIKAITTPASKIAQEKVRREALQQSSMLNDAIRTAMSALRSALKSQLVGQLISGVKSAVGIATGIIGGAIVYSANAYQRGLSMALPTASALRSMTTNIPSELYSILPSLTMSLQDVARRYGVSVAELSNALENILPLISDHSLINLKAFAELFAQLKYLENITPEEFQILGNIALITNRTMENIAELYSTLTDYVGQSSKQVLTELKKLSSDFGSDLLEDLFAFLEYFQRYISVDPKDAIATLQRGINDLNKMWQGALPIEQLGEEAKRLLEISQSELYQQIKSKYVSGLSTIAESYEQLMTTAPAQFEAFFAKQRESLQTAMYNFVINRQTSLENVYRNIQRFTTTFFGEFEPIARSLFISPETGMPTMMTALIPVIEKLSGIHNLVEMIYNALTAQTSEQYETNTEFWIRQFRQLIDMLAGKLSITDTNRAIANYQGAIY